MSAGLAIKLGWFIATLNLRKGLKFWHVRFDNEFNFKCLAS
jgi:hypothetical protein